SDNPVSIYGTTTVNIPKGEGRVDVSLPVDISVPIDEDAYSIVAYLSRSGGSVQDSFDSIRRSGIDVLAPPASDARLSDLMVDGSTVSDFYESTEVYDIELPEGTTDVPVVTATATDENADVQVTNAEGLPGTATVLVTAEDGITSNTYTINFTVATPTVSIDKPLISNKEFVEIYPNPVNKELYFRFQDSGTPKKISIYNTFGQQLYCNQTKKAELEIDVNSLYAKGIIMIRIDSEDDFSYHRVVIN
ncbi:MAG: T9SS type A sorting domain-containing protein, partial [Bacteroidales bacterium]|nr:T9SS type A sorting domain-containing protein [Bacteroidales bacterium]